MTREETSLQNIFSNLPRRVYEKGGEGCGGGVLEILLPSFPPVRGALGGVTTIYILRTE